MQKIEYMNMQPELTIFKKKLKDMLDGNRALKKAVRRINKQDMIKGSLVVRNAEHEALAIDRILEGELQRDVPVGDYVFIEKFSEMIDMAFSNMEMGNSLDRNLLVRAYGKLAEDPDASFRKSNPVVYMFNHVPPHRVDIENLIAGVLRKVYSGEGDVVMKAMFLHNKIIDIYPFDEYNGEIAIFAMNYYLLDQGLMPVTMPIARDVYIELVTACLKGSRQEEFYNFLHGAISEKMRETVAACGEVI